MPDITWGRPTELPIDPFGTPDRGFDTFRVTSPFGVRDDPLNPGHTVFHGGLDIGNARLGDTVTAVADGRIEAVGNLGLPWSQPSTQWPSGNFGGLMVVIAHAGTHISLYAHLGKASAKVGTRVQSGQPIGVVGESGSATGHGHLHFGISNHSAQEITQRGLLLPNSWMVDPWPLIKDAAEDQEVIAELQAKLAECRLVAERRRLRIVSLEERRDALVAKVAELESLPAAELAARLDEIRDIANQPIPEDPE